MMKEIKVQELTKDNFNIYGSFANMVDPQGPHLGEEPCEFYRDMGVLTLGRNSNAGMSITRVKMRPMIIRDLEYHNFTGEAIVPLDGDIYIHVGVAGPKDKMPFDKLEVFRVPKGTLVIVRPGVWHHGPFAVNDEYVNTLVVLPERTYANDCISVSIPEEKWCRIVR
ncbi:MAG: ureidoglycolate lyase [Flexilinea sp.]